MKKRQIWAAALLSLCFLLTACAPQTAETENYIQLKEPEQAEEENAADTQDSQQSETTNDADDAADERLEEADDGNVVSGETEHGWGWQQALEGYGKYLENVEIADTYDESAFYLLGDINGDGIPELLVKTGHVDWIDAIGDYSYEIELDTYIPSSAGENQFYSNLQVKTVATGDGTGGWYYPGTGVIAMNNGEGEDYAEYYYFPECTTDLENWPGDTMIGEIGMRSGEEVNYWKGKYDTNAAEETYRFPDEEGSVDRKTFKKLLKQITGGVKETDFPSADEWHSNTEENRETYL